ARDPELAQRRIGEATGVIARALAQRGLDLVAISTNEVFDGRRVDGRGYAPSDATGPLNPYGASKLAGEELARQAYTGAGAPALEPYERHEGVPDAPQLAIVRTAWLFGPGQPDFPMKILAAAERAQVAHEPLKAVNDETGCPGCITSSTAAPPPEPPGPARSSASPACRSRSRRSRHPPGPARPPRRSGPSSSPRPRRRASPSGRGR